MCSAHLFKYMRVVTRATDVARVLHGLDLGVNVMDSCCFAICLLSGCFSTNCIKQLAFLPLKVFTLRSWKSTMCVHILSRQGVGM